MSSFVRKTCAKINLSLHITGKRENGYHELESIVAFADIGDRISVTSAENLVLSVNGEFASELHTNDDNLVLRAARTLQQKTDTKKGAQLTLEKNLPVASGIGGGSGDAAATLLLLRDFWNLEIEDAALHELALSLGADVPMCLKNESAIVRGIGEEIELIVLPGWHVLLVNPGIALSTSKMFHDYAAANIPFDVARITYADDWLAALMESHNALEEVAIKRVPMIGEVIKRVSSTEKCLLSRMSGSGATCFGLFETEAWAVSAKEFLAASYPSFWLKTASLLVNKN